jgi:hypothetical protein
MSGQALDHLTCREKLRDAAHLTRELVEHLEQGFSPKLQELIRQLKVRPGDATESVSDTTVRNLAAAILDSERFTSQLEDRLTRYCDSIFSDVQQMARKGG